MITISILGLDQFVVGRYSREHSADLANLFESDENLLNFYAPNAMGCAFCASGLLKKERNLTAAEMVGQVLVMNELLAPEKENVTHIVVMGTGEPFDNYDNVLAFVHIMVANPLKLGPEYARAGADIVTFHYEACSNDQERWATINAIRGAGAKVGMSIKPMSSPAVLYPFIKELDLVLVMSVEPGKGGQAFMSEALDKLKDLRAYIDAHHPTCLLEVDGGINAETSKLAVAAGANVLVAGSYLYGHDDFKARVEGLLAL